MTTMTAGEVALEAQAALKAIEENAHRLHGLLANLALRSGAGQTLAASDVTALGLDPTAPVPDDDSGPTGPGTKP